MKLKLLFIVMDLLTVLVYPFLFIHGKLRRFAKSNEGITLDLIPVAVTVSE
jgi:hypothetical protein